MYYPIRRTADLESDMEYSDVLWQLIVFLGSGGWIVFAARLASKLKIKEDSTTRVSTAKGVEFFGYPLLNSLPQAMAGWVWGFPGSGSGSPGSLLWY